MKFVTILFLFVGLSASADAIVQIEGKLTSIRRDDVVVETQDMIFTVDKTSIHPDLMEAMDRPGQQVKVPVRMEDIQKIEYKKEFKTTAEK